MTYELISLCIYIVGTGLAPVRERVPVRYWPIVSACWGGSDRGEPCPYG